MIFRLIGISSQLTFLHIHDRFDRNVSFSFVNPFNDMAITGDVSGTVFLSQILLVIRLLPLT